MGRANAEDRTEQEVELVVIPSCLLPYTSIISVVTEPFQIRSSSGACILYPTFFLEFVEMLLGLTSLATRCHTFSLTSLYLMSLLLPCNSLTCQSRLSTDFICSLRLHSLASWMLYQIVRHCEKACIAYCLQRGPLSKNQNL